MNSALIHMSGFRSGMIKAAASMAYDNQPGPHPGTPAPPDSHRKRNVALGAALLVGGALGTKHLYSMGGRMAQANRTNMAKAIGQHARSAAGDATRTQAVRNVAKRFQEGYKKPIGWRERGKALLNRADSSLADALGQSGPYPHGRPDARRSGGNLFNKASPTTPGSRTANRLDPNSSARREEILKNYAKLHGDGKWKKRLDSAKRKGKMVGYTAIAAGGATAAGASAASRAKEQQDDQTPGS